MACTGDNRGNHKMPIEKKPGSPVAYRYTAPGFREYKVKDNDSWESLARTYNMEVWELIYQNFKTQKTLPKQIGIFIIMLAAQKRPKMARTGYLVLRTLREL